MQGGEEERLSCVVDASDLENINTGTLRLKNCTSERSKTCVDKTNELVNIEPTRTFA